MRLHVVPVPAGRREIAADGADVPHAEPAAGRGGEPEVTVLGTGAQAFSVELRVLAAREPQLRERFGQPVSGQRTRALPCQELYTGRELAHKIGSRS